MTSGRMLRPVLSLVLGAFVTACSGVEGDPNRFENMARQIASIPLDGEEPQTRAAADTAATRGLRPALPVSAQGGDLRVEVMDPHDLWDARDGLRGRIPVQVADLAPPTLAIEDAPAPVVARATPSKPAVERTLVQLGAYSSIEGARAAWAEVNKGRAGRALAGLNPEFATIQVNGKPLVRLRVSAPADGAAAICRAAEIADAWCLRGA